MKTKERIEILSNLRPILINIADKKEWTGYDLGISKDEYDKLVHSITLAKIQNPWLTKESVLESFRGVSSWLTVSDLTNWVSQYSFKETNPGRLLL